MHRHKWLLLLAVPLTAAALLIAGSVASAAPFREHAYFEGQTLTIQIPAIGSHDPNQGLFACFDSGPAFKPAQRPAAPIYVIVAPGASQHACPGTTDMLLHDHVLSTAPGHPGYTGAWDIIQVTPCDLPTFDETLMPIKDLDALDAAVTAGELCEADSGYIFLGSIR